MSSELRDKDELSRIKRNISESYVYFQENRKYFNDMRNFVLKTTITDEQRAALDRLDRAQIEFNSLEAYISRLIGEFSKQTPGINVFADPTTTIPPEKTIDFVQGNMRNILNELRAVEVYRDQLTGGFSCLKVWTEYENPRSFNQNIKLDRVYDPLLIGFDPCAQKSHKGDGSYCFEIIPLTEPQFRQIYGYDINLQGCYTGNIEGFKWGYKSNRKNVVMLCYYYEKKSRKTMLYELPNGMAMTKKEYEELLHIYKDRNEIAQPPIPVNKRWTYIPYVTRYEIISTQILDKQETDFCGLPLIFVDGNSATLRRNSDGGIIEQVTKSYVHNAVGIQKLKNLAGQSIANHMELMTENKMKIANESIPPEYEGAYTNPQCASNYIYNQYSDDGTREYNPPQEVVKVPLPPEVLNTFMNADQITQACLGSYDASLGINKQQLSGVAIVEGATQSNAAAMPFVVNYLSALQQAAEIILDLIPKYYVTPRSMPVINGEDKRQHVTINGADPKSPRMNFNPSDLKIEVKAGVNFEVQKTRALQMLIELSQALPGMAQIINNPKGLAIVADNLSFKGSDQIKQMAEKAAEQMEANKGQPPPPNPVLMKLNLEQQKAASKDQNEKQGLALKAQEIQNKHVASILKASDSQLRTAADIEENRMTHAHKAIDQHIAATKVDNAFAKGLIDSASNLMSQSQPDQGSLPPQSQVIPQQNQQ